MDRRNPEEKIEEIQKKLERTQAAKEALAELQKHRGWAIYSELVKGQIAGVEKALTTSLDQTTIVRSAGLLAGLRFVETLAESNVKALDTQIQSMREQLNKLRKG